MIHANAEERAISWKNKLTNQFGFEPNFMMAISTVVAMSAGQGSVAVAIEIEESGN